MAIVPDVIDMIAVLIIGGLGYSIGHGRGHEKGYGKAWDKEMPKAYERGYDDAKAGKERDVAYTEETED